MPKVKEDARIRFFGEIDCNEKDGTIKSDMPAWYFDVHITNLEESLSRKKRMLERGLIPQEQVQMTKNQIAGEQARLDAIKASKPTLEGRNKDLAYNAYISLGKQIKDSMPTRKESRNGLVNPHEELKRLKEKHISISPEIAKACGVNVFRGHISGDEANKCYQILGKALGENTNVERLRRDGDSEAYQSMNDLTQAILKGSNLKV